MTNAQTEPTPEHTGPWRVVLVDDHGIFRAGVRHELEQASDKVEIVGEGEDVATSVKAILATVPDVVLLDVHLPGGGGAEVIKKVHATQPKVKFLALSVSDAAEDVIGVIRAGARGYVTKSISTDDLIDSIGRVATNDAVFSPRLAGFVLDAFSGSIDVASIDEDLDKTVETHVSSVLRKLQLSNRYQLTKWATDRKLV